MDRRSCLDLVLPGFVDGHCHLDKTFAGLPWRGHRAGNSVAERIEAERAGRAQLPLPVADRARALLRQMVATGTVALRTHVDVDTAIGLDHLHALLRLREEVQGIIELQIVAFPQSGILRDPGVLGLLDAALADGADLVGGLDPVAIDADRDGHLDAVFALAERHGKGIDVHLHEPGDTGLATIDAIVERTRAGGLAGRVAISHAFALGDAPLERSAALFDRMARAGVAVVTSAPGSAPMPPVRRMRAAGVELFAGSDNIRDAWSPLGNGDLLERAMLVAWRQNLRTDEDLALAFDLVSDAPRRAANFAREDGTTVTLAAETLAEAIALRPRARRVARGDRVLAEDGACVAGLLARP